MAKHNKWKKTLFFIAGSAATEAEIEASAEFEPGVQFRNAAFSNPKESLESFDFLAGAIPPHYQAALDARESKAAVVTDAPPLDPAKVPKEKPVTPPTPNANAGWKPNA